jgi:hypothetical protein
LAPAPARTVELPVVAGMRRLAERDNRAIGARIRAIGARIRRGSGHDHHWRRPTATARSSTITGMRP